MNIHQRKQGMIHYTSNPYDFKQKKNNAVLKGYGQKFIASLKGCFISLRFRIRGGR